MNSFWEFAPVGRPHLYPPLFHILMLAVYKIIPSKPFLARFFDFIIFPASLVIIWITIKNVFNRRLAFFAVLTASSVYTLYLSIITTIPATLSILCGLLSFFCIEKQRIIAGTVLLIFAFYLHAFMPWIMALAFIIYALLCREKLKRYLLAVAIAILAALPLLIHSYVNRSYFHFIRVGENNFIEFSLLIFSLGVFGVIIALRRKGAYYFLIAFAAALLLIAINYPYRYLSAQGVFGVVILAAVTLDFIYEKVSASGKLSAVYFLAAIVLFFSFTVTISPDAQKDKRGVFFNSTFINLIPALKNKERANEASLLINPKMYKSILENIEANTSVDDIIYSNSSYFAGLLSFLSGRATSSGMLSEIRPAHNFDPLAAAKLAIFITDIDDFKENPILYYKNPTTKAKRILPKPFIPNFILFTLFFLTLSLLALDCLFTKKRLATGKKI